MAGRNLVFVTDEYYHVYNRGVARQPTFTTKHNYKQARLTLDYYSYIIPPLRLSRLKEHARQEIVSLLTILHKEGKRLVDIISFVFMPNHFHFLLRQKIDQGISRFVSQFTNSYTRYYNTKQNRPGPLFQGVFKGVHVETQEQLLHLSRYIHLNPLVSGIVRYRDFISYPWSSFPDYLKGQSTVVNLEPILSSFALAEKYKEFVLDQVTYASELEKIKHLVYE